MTERERLEAQQAVLMDLVKDLLSVPKGQEFEAVTARLNDINKQLRDLAD